MENSLLDILIEELLKIGVKKSLKSHEILVHTGKKANKIYLVLEGGLVLLHVHPKTGQERAINFFIPDFHPIATVAQSYVLLEPSKYQLETFTTTELLEIERSQLDAFLKTSPMAQSFQEFGYLTLLEKNELRAMFISLSSEEMLQYLHSNYPQILQKVPSKYIANFLGITPQWLSKLKHSL